MKQNIQQKNLGWTYPLGNDSITKSVFFFFRSECDFAFHCGGQVPLLEHWQHLGGFLTGMWKLKIKFTLSRAFQSIPMVTILFQTCLYFIAVTFVILMLTGIKLLWYGYLVYPHFHSVPETFFSQSPEGKCGLWDISQKGKSFRRQSNLFFSDRRPFFFFFSIK